MAESGSGQEKTEQATAKKLQDTRDQGQVPRSRELNTLIMMLSAGFALLFFGAQLVEDLSAILRSYFSVQREILFRSDGLAQMGWEAIVAGIQALLPLFFVLVLAAVVAPLALGGWAFNLESMSPKLEKLDPISGMKRVFSWKGFMEMTKSLVKLLLVGAAGFLILQHKLPEFLLLGNIEFSTAAAKMGTELIWIFIFLSATLIIVALVDVPFQLWEYHRQLKMTLQETKDEHKDSEGSPELKNKIRQTQREMARRRMMEAVPKADVIITNPTHYAVALRYDQLTMRAPVVVALGADLVALQIRRVASANDVPILEAPPLARALYSNSILGGEIPAGLYLAVAQVLAYIYQLKQYARYGGIAPVPLGDIPVPDDMAQAGQ